MHDRHAVKRHNQTAIRSSRKTGNDIFDVVGLPYAEQTQMGIDEIKGGSPYGASTIAGAQGERMPSQQELSMARFQGRHVTTIAAKLFS